MGGVKAYKHPVIKSKFWGPMHSTESSVNNNTLYIFKVAKRINVLTIHYRTVRM